MCLDDEVDYSDEVSPNKLQFIPPLARVVSRRKVQTFSKGQQICMGLEGRL